MPDVHGETLRNKWWIWTLPVLPQLSTLKIRGSLYKFWPRDQDFKFLKGFQAPRCTPCSTYGSCWSAGSVWGLVSTVRHTMHWLAVCSWVFLFILRLRFPKHSSFVQLLNIRYGVTCIGLYRKLEKSHYRYNKTKLDIDFLRKCKAYNTVPKFLHFKLHNPDVKKTKTYQSCQFKLLNLEINNKNSLLNKQLGELESSRLQFKTTVSLLDFKCLYTRLQISNEAKLKNDKFTHDKILNEQIMLKWVLAVN